MIKACTYWIAYGKVGCGLGKKGQVLVPRGDYRLIDAGKKYKRNERVTVDCWQEKRDRRESRSKKECRLVKVDDGCNGRRV